jgi:hypothetical protein
VLRTLQQALASGEGRDESFADVLRGAREMVARHLEQAERLAKDRGR